MSNLADPEGMHGVAWQHITVEAMVDVSSVEPTPNLPGFIDISFNDAEAPLVRIAAYTRAEDRWAIGTNVMPHSRKITQEGDRLTIEPPMSLIGVESFNSLDEHVLYRIMRHLILGVRPPIEETTSGITKIH